MCLQSAQQPEPVSVQVDDDDDDQSQTFELPSPTRNGATCSKRTWKYDVPERSILNVEDEQMPAMPNLESVLGNSLQSVRQKERLFIFFCHRPHYSSQNLRDYIFEKISKTHRAM